MCCRLALRKRTSEEIALVVKDTNVCMGNCTLFGQHMLALFLKSIGIISELRVGSLAWWHRAP